MKAFREINFIAKSPPVRLYTLVEHGRHTGQHLGMTCFHFNLESQFQYDGQIIFDRAAEKTHTFHADDEKNE